MSFVVICVDMKIIDRCPNCFSPSDDNNNNYATDKRMKHDEEAEYAEILDDKSKNKAKQKKKKRNLLMPLAIFMLNAADKKISDRREFYSKFYTSSCIQPRVFCHGKKYEIERKHKVKKRDLLNDKLSNNAISGCGKYSTLSQVTTTETANDNIGNEGESEPFNFTSEYMR